MTLSESVPFEGVGYRCFPLGEVQVTAEVDVEEMPARPKYPNHLGEEAVEVRVAVRGLDVEHRVEGLIGERQVLGVAVHEIQPGRLCRLANAMPSGLKSNPVYEAGCSVLIEVRAAAAVTAAGLQHFFTAEIGLGRRAVIELNAVPVGLIRSRNGRPIGGSSS